MRIGFLLTILSIASLAGCKNTAPSSSAHFGETPVDGRISPHSYDDPDAYAIYGTLLGRKTNGSSFRQAILVLNQTNTHDLCIDPASQPTAQLREAAADFVRENARAQALDEEKMKSEGSFQFISRAELDQLFAGGPAQGWVKFREAHGKIGGYVDVSAVGFSRDRTVALVYSGSHCGPLCGAGGVQTFVRQGSAWKPLDSASLCRWIS